MTTSLNIFSFIINDGTLGTRPLRRANQTRRNIRHKRQRNANRICQRRVQTINNETTLDRITNLPTQVTSDPLIHEFFSGIPSF